jgi:4'-phosphopantetheinyl transferase
MLGLPRPMTATPVCSLMRESPHLAGCSFNLSKNDVHVWNVHTRASDALAAQFEPLLVAAERDRAARFRFEHLRRSSVVTRGALRCLLGRYLRLHAASIQFNYGAKGKPSVESAERIQFNTTHSGSLAVFAFTLDCEIGVDLEQIHSLRDAQSIADRFFCSEEAAEIMSLSPGERDRGFFRCWTRKEAYIKAIGDGLSAPLNNFRVRVQPDEPAGFVHLGNDTHAAKAWMLQDLCLDPGYAAALAYKDRERSLSIFQIVDPSLLLEFH